MRVKIICPRCNGEGTIAAPQYSSITEIAGSCPLCNGAKLIEGELAAGESERIKDKKNDPRQQN